MPAPLAKAEIDRRVQAVHEALKAGHKPEVAPRIAANAMGINDNTFREWIPC